MSEPRDIPTPDQPPTFPPIGSRTLADYLTIYEGVFTEVGLRSHWYELMGINASSTGGTPSGPAGGSLTGTYPNPLIATGAVSAAMLAPGLTVPPSGPAGGDVQGFYPNPTLSRIGASRVEFVARGLWYVTPTGVGFTLNDPNLTSYNQALLGWQMVLENTLGRDDILFSRRPAASASYTDLVTFRGDGTIRVTTDPLVALDLATKQYVDAHGSGLPSGAAGGDFTGSTYPDPVLAPGVVTRAKLAGAVAIGIPQQAQVPQDVGKVSTVDSGGNAVWTALPTTAWSDTGTIITPVNQARPVVLSPIPAPLQWGNATAVKNRLLCEAGALGSQWRVNAAAGATGALDDSTKAAWTAFLDLTTDSFGLYRSAPAATATWVQALKLDATAQFLVGLAAIKTGLWPGADGSYGGMTINQPWAPQDSTKPSWSLLGYTTADQFIIGHRAANAAAGSVTTGLMVNGADGKTYCTLADQSVALGMLAAKATTRGLVQGTLPVNFASLTLNTWLPVVTTPALTTRGGYVLVFISPGALVVTTATGGTLYYGLFRDGAALVTARFDAFTGGGSSRVPAPPMLAWDVPPAGSHTYSFQVYQVGQNGFFTNADNTGYIQAMEFA